MKVLSKIASWEIPSFGPEKKYLAPHPINSPQTASWPLAPPAPTRSGEPPPLSSQGAAEAVRQKEFDHFFHFRDAFGHFSVTFSDASVTFFVTFLPNSFCRTPFAARWPTAVFNLKSSTPLPAPRTLLSPLPSRKNKNIRNVHQDYVLVIVFLVHGLLAPQPRKTWVIAAIWITWHHKTCKSLGHLQN